MRNPLHRYLSLPVLSPIIHPPPDTLYCHTRARAQVTADKVEQIYKLRQAVRVAIDYALSHGSPATYLSSEQLDSATEVVIKIIGAQHG